MGQGVNIVTGDYSRGAAGFWVEGGEIAYPVEEITIAGNLRDMFKASLPSAPRRLHRRAARRSGSVLIERMKIAGSERAPQGLQPGTAAGGGIPAISTLLGFV